MADIGSKFVQFEAPLPGKALNIADEPHRITYLGIYIQLTFLYMDYRINILPKKSAYHKSRKIIQK